MRYLLRELTAPEWQTNLIYVTQDTTGVAGGGVVKAIVRAGMGRDYRPVDSIGYRDPNVPCDSFPGVRWFNSRFTLGDKRLYGWLPTRMPPEGSRREC